MFLIIQGFKIKQHFLITAYISLYKNGYEMLIYLHILRLTFLNLIAIYTKLYT